MPSDSSIKDAHDYKSMHVGDRVKMPRDVSWAGENQNLFWEIQEYCMTAEDQPQFEVETVRPPGSEVQYWLKRTR